MTCFECVSNYCCIAEVLIAIFIKFELFPEGYSNERIWEMKTQPKELRAFSIRIVSDGNWLGLLRTKVNEQIIIDLCEALGVPYVGPGTRIPEKHYCETHVC